MTSPSVPEQRANLGATRRATEMECIAVTEWMIAKGTALELQQQIDERSQQLATLTKAYERLGAEVEAKDARIRELEAHACRETLRCVTCARIHLECADQHEQAAG